MPKSSCSMCRGTGWKTVESNGERGVVRCSCEAARETEGLLARAQIPRRYDDCEFANFYVPNDPETNHPNSTLAAAKMIAERLVEEYPTDIGLVFLGPTGVGKTHLAVATLRELAQRKGVECRFQDFRELLKAIQGSYNPISQSSELHIVQPIVEAEVLLLDELAEINPTDWMKITLGYIINARYNRKKLTLITTTLPLPAGDASAKRKPRMPSGEPLPDIEVTLDRLGPTLNSRLHEMCKFVPMHSYDYRKAIKQGRARVQGR